MANAADIVVNLVAKTGSFTRGMDRGRKKMNTLDKGARKLSRTFSRLGGALAGLGVGLSVAGIVRMTKEAIALNDELGKFATRLGIATDQLKILQIAADLSGQKVNALTVGLQRMVRRVNEAAVGTGEAKQAIIDLGLDSLKLAKLKPDEIFMEIAGRMDDVASQGQRIQLAFKLLDTEGVGLINTMALLNTEGFKAIIRSAREMNAVLDDFEVAQFEAGADALTITGLAFEGIKNTIALELLPATVLWQDAMTGVATEAGKVDSPISSFVISTVRVLGNLIGIAKLFQTIGRLIITIGLQFVNFVLKPVEGLEQALRHLIGGFGVGRGGGRFFGGINTENTFVGSYRIALRDAAVEQDRLIADFPGILGTSDAFVKSWGQALARIRASAKTIDEERRRMAEIGDELTRQLEIRKAAAKAEQVALARRKKLEALIRGTLTQEEIIQGKIKTITDALIEGEGDRNALIEARRRLEEDLLEIANKAGELSQVGIQAVRNLQDAFTEFFLNTKEGFKGLLQSFVDLLRRMIAELLARQVLLAFLGLLAKGSGGLGKFAKKVLKDIKKKQLGGPLGGGEPALVGEAGPELFIPRSAGTVIPAGKFGGISIMHNITVNGADPARTAEILAPLLARNRQQTVAELNVLRAKGRF